MMKKILQKILAGLARTTLRKYDPMVVGITGSAGKTSAREAINSVLKMDFSVRSPRKNYNNEIGLPLAILGAAHPGKNIFRWLGILLSRIYRLVVKDSDYPDMLVLEYGVDRPRDMEYLLNIARPDVAVVTGLGSVPAHIEFFRNAEEIASEKVGLVKAVPAAGAVILNYDDPAVLSMKKETAAKVITYGFGGGADLRIINYELRKVKNGEGEDIPDGVTFKIEYQGKIVPMRLHSIFGKPQVYSAAAAAVVGIFLNLNLVEIAEALASWSPPPGRLRLLRGIEGSYILDDTYNAGPGSTEAALNTLQLLPGKRKIAVLGDMLELGEHAERTHREIGRKVAEFADMLMAVGKQAEFIAEEAEKRGLSPDKIIRLKNSSLVGFDLDHLIKKKDLILVKGSQGMRMEKIVERLMFEPLRAPELLVRQEKYWKDK